jgi:hypothetical protein
MSLRLVAGELVSDSGVGSFSRQLVVDSTTTSGGEVNQLIEVTVTMCIYRH